MKLQKLVYFAHGWYLAIQDKALIEEPVEAWQYGPVIRSIYDEFKKYGRNYIQTKATYYDFSSKPFHKFDYKINENDKKDSKLLDDIWDIYGALDAYELSRITHYENSPWTIIVTENRDKFNQIYWSTIIPNDMIKAYFREIMNENK